MILSAPAIILTGIVTLLALILTVILAIGVSRARRRHALPPPVQSGPEDFERVLRVHANTIEALVLFVPSLWLAALYFQGWIPPVIGFVWLLGRIVYAVGYRASSDGRVPGFVIAMLSTLALMVLAGIGLVGAWGAVG